MVIHRNINERVEAIGVGFGTVINIREDTDRRPIYTVCLDDSSVTPDGLYYARAEEMRSLPYERSL